MPGHEMEVAAKEEGRRAMQRTCFNRKAPVMWVLWNSTTSLAIWQDTISILQTTLISKALVSLFIRKWQNATVHDEIRPWEEGGRRRRAAKRK